MATETVESPAHLPGRGRKRGVRGIIPEELEVQLAARELVWADLLTARGGPFNPGTVGKLRHGRPVTSQTIDRLLKFLRRHPVDPLAARLMGISGTPAA